MDNEKIISESGTEGVGTETEFDPISAINDIKANHYSLLHYKTLQNSHLYNFHNHKPYQ